MEPRIIFVFLLFLGAKVNLLGKFLYDLECIGVNRLVNV